MAFPGNELQKTNRQALKNIDHALVLQEDGPLLPAILKVYDEAQGIRNQMKGPCFKRNWRRNLRNAALSLQRRR